MGVRPVAGRQTSTKIVGQSAATVRLRAEIVRAARFSSSVLITGPSGTGKELVARQIHACSPRSQQPFVPVDCASITGELMSSQLFGHIKGAFTGANYDSLGCFRAANGGTLFLDEIGELELTMQAKLLRVLQERVVTPVGSHQGERVDVRVVAATNRELQSEVRAGRFREDLYYRLDVVHVRTMALRDRRDDVPLLAHAFLKQLAEDGLPRCSIAADALGELIDFGWPGNVRQLRNVLEQAAIDCEASVITADLLRQILSLSFATSDCEVSGAANFELDDCSLPAPQNLLVGVDANWQTLECIERDHILRTLEHTFYNRSAAARLLGVTRQSLLRKMKRFCLDSPPRRH